MRGWVDLGAAGGAWITYLIGWRAGLVVVATVALSGAAASSALRAPWLVIGSCAAAAAVVAAAEDLRRAATRVRAVADAQRQQHDEMLAEQLVRHQAAETANAHRETQLQQVTSLYQFSKTLAGSLEFEALVRMLDEAIRQQFRCGRCRTFLFDAEGRVSLVGEAPVAGAALSLRPPQPDERELTAMLERLAGPVCAGIGRDLTSGAVAMGVLPFVAVPLIVERRAVGALVVEELTPEAYRHLVSFSHQLSLALKRSSLYLLVQQLAITDGLTGLSVRRYLLQRLDEECRRAARLGQPLSVAMADLDQFKTLNDTYGHLAGDAVLRTVGARLREAIREIDLAGRYGGEEFCIILPSTDEASAQQVAERMRTAVASEPVRAYDEALSVTISIGLVTVRGETIAMEEVIDRADRALYAAKSGGRDRVVVFENRS